MRHMPNRIEGKSLKLGYRSYDLGRRCQLVVRGITVLTWSPKWG